MLESFLYPPQRSRVATFQIDDARWSNQLEQVVERVTSRGMRQFVSERLHPKGVIDVGNRSQPSDAHVSVRGTVLYSQVGDVEWNVGPSLPERARTPVHRGLVEGRRDWRKRRALKPGSGHPVAVERGLQVHGRHAVVVAELDIIFARPDHLDRASYRL